MGKAVAKHDDRVTATDTHIVLVPSPGGTVPTPMPIAFDGPLDENLSADVYAEDKPVALDDSTANNQPPHVAPAGTFQTPPSNRATVVASSGSVFANDRAVARDADRADTCDDLQTPHGGVVSAGGSVLAGD